MSADFTTWLVRSLELPLFEETPRGGVRANSAARRRLGEARPAGLTDAIAITCGLAGAPTELVEAVAKARRGDPQEIQVGSRRVAIAPIGKGRASAVVAPLTLEPDVDSRTQARAAAADLAAGVSHELANALGAIAGWASLARRGGNVNEALKVIESSAESAWSVARHMLGRMSGRASEGTTSVDASELVEQVARLLGPRAAQAGVHIERRIAGGIVIDGQHADLWSAVWNIALNGIEAMNNGGTLLLQLSATNDRASIVIGDTGPGMSPELQSKIFEPYHTTKATGSGIGLATVKRAIDALGGEIVVKSAVGQGSRFELQLPRKTRSGTPTVRRLKAVSERSSGVFRAEKIHGRVLVVDDDPALREMTATALSVRGAEVVAVGSPHEALATEGNFDVALIDMLLPEMTGDVLLRNLRAAGKVRAGLLVTGTEIAQMRLTAGGEPDGVLRKPFRLDDMFDRVVELLRSQSEQSSSGTSS